MPSLGEIVKSRKHLPAIVAVLRSLEDQPKLMRDLERLYFAKAGIHVQRDRGRRARGETIWSCSRVGAAFSRHDDLVAALKRRAASHGRSAEAEHRMILGESQLDPKAKKRSFKEVLASMPHFDDDVLFDVR